MQTIVLSLMGLVFANLAQAGSQDFEDLPVDFQMLQSPMQSMFDGPGPVGFGPSSEDSCVTDWGYDECEDTLTIFDLETIDLGWLCSSDMVEYDDMYEPYDRGMFAITDFSYTESSWSMWYIVICGEGDYFYGATHGYDYDWGEEGYDWADFIMDTLGEFGTSEPYGVDADGLSEIFYEDMLEKIEEKKVLDAWNALHSDVGTDTHTDEDTDSDDDASNSDSDSSTEYYDDGGSYCDLPWVLC